MNRFIVPWNHTDACRGSRHVLTLFAVLCCALTAPAQSTRQSGNASAPFSIRATHLLGFENAKGNCTGTLSIHDDSLQFRQNGKAGVQVEIGAIRGIFLGKEDKKVGGLPMTLGKPRHLTAVAKKYDIVTLKYVDSDGGVHGAIFQLPKEHGEIARNQLGVSWGSHRFWRRSAAETRQSGGHQ